MKRYNFQNPPNKSNTTFITILVIVILLIIGIYILYKILNRKYKRNAKQYIEDYTKFKSRLSYDKKDRKSTIKEFYEILMLTYKKKSESYRKPKFLDYSSPRLYEEALDTMLNDVCNYMEKILRLDIKEFEAPQSALLIIDEAKGNLNDKSWYVDIYIYSIWYTGKRAVYFSKIITVVDILISRMRENDNSDEMLNIFEKISTLNEIEKKFFDSYGPINMRFEIYKGSNPQYRTGFEDVEALLNDINLVEKRYNKYCLEYIELMDGIYKA